MDLGTTVSEGYCKGCLSSVVKKVQEYEILLRILYNYPPKGSWIVVDIHRDARRQGIYPPLFTNTEGDRCFSIYQNRWIKKRLFKFFFQNFRETTSHFSLRLQNSEYPRIFRVTGANQNTRKLLSTDLVNTKFNYYCSPNSKTTQ